MTDTSGMKLVTIIVLSILITFLMLIKACAENFRAGISETNIIPGAEWLPGSQSRKAALKTFPENLSPAPAGRVVRARKLKG